MRILRQQDAHSQPLPGARSSSSARCCGSSDSIVARLSARASGAARCSRRRNCSTSRPHPARCTKLERRRRASAADSRSYASRSSEQLGAHRRQPTAPSSFSGTTGRGMPVFVEYRSIALDGPHRHHVARAALGLLQAARVARDHRQCRAASLSMAISPKPSYHSDGISSKRACAKQLVDVRHVAAAAHVRSAASSAPRSCGRGAPARQRGESMRREPRRQRQENRDALHRARIHHQQPSPRSKWPRLRERRRCHRSADGSPPPRAPDAFDVSGHVPPDGHHRPPPGAPAPPRAASGFQLAGPKGKNCGVCAR